MAAEITYAGVTLAAVSGELCAAIEADISLSGIWESQAPGWSGKNRRGYQAPWPLETHPFRLGRLYWPADAARWAVGHFLATDRQLAQIGSAGAAHPFTLADGRSGYQISTSLYALPARPLAQTAGKNGLSLLTLVDVRWYWWERAANVVVIPGGTTWAGLLQQVAGALGINLQIGAIAGNYLAPPKELSAHYESLPQLLDAACYDCGLRCVRRLNGTCLAQHPTDALASQTAQQARWQRRKGGLFTLTTRAAAVGPQQRTDLNAVVPQSVLVVFSRPPHDALEPDPPTVTVALAELNLPELRGIAGHAGSHLVHVDTLLAFAADGPSVSLAQERARSYYRWLLGAQDQQFLGIVPYLPEGLGGSIEWSAREDDVTTRVQRDRARAPAPALPDQAQVLKIKSPVPSSNGFYDCKLMKPDGSGGYVEWEPIWGKDLANSTQLDVDSLYLCRFAGEIPGGSLTPGRLLYSFRSAGGTSNVYDAVSYYSTVTYNNTVNYLNDTVNYLGVPVLNNLVSTQTMTEQVQVLGTDWYYGGPLQEAYVYFQGPDTKVYVQDVFWYFGAPGPTAGTTVYFQGNTDVFVQGGNWYFGTEAEYLTLDTSIETNVTFQGKKTTVTVFGPTWNFGDKYNFYPTTVNFFGSQTVVNVNVGKWVFGPTTNLNIQFAPVVYNTTTPPPNVFVIGVLLFPGPPAWPATTGQLWCDGPTLWQGYVPPGGKPAWMPIPASSNLPDPIPGSPGKVPVYDPITHTYVTYDIIQVSPDASSMGFFGPPVTNVAVTITQQFNNYSILVLQPKPSTSVDLVIIKNSGGVSLIKLDNAFNLIWPTTSNPAVSPGAGLSLPTITATGTPSWTPTAGTYPAVWGAGDQKLWLWDGAAWQPTNPLTTKGDLFGFGSGGVRVPVGSDGQVLTVDSTAPSGVKWAVPPSPGWVAATRGFGDFATGSGTSPWVDLVTLPAGKCILAFAIYGSTPFDDGAGAITTVAIQLEAAGADEPVQALSSGWGEYLGNPTVYYGENAFAISPTGVDRVIQAQISSTVNTDALTQGVVQFRFLIGNPGF